MHSEALMLQIGGLNGETHKKYLRNAIQRTAVIIGDFGTDKSVPYAHVGTHSFYQTDKSQFPGLGVCQSVSSIAANAYTAMLMNT